MSHLCTKLTLIAALLTSSLLQQASAEDRYGLLVGCTVYPNLNEKFHLIGPANDVVLAREMLVKRFEFPDENVITLADTMEKEELMPTRANIAREWEALAAKAKAGDQVFVLMAGHGTQAPMKDIPGNTEADGLDEMFLPRDVGPWDDSVGEVTNGIKDDDIKGWVAAIQNKGAHLWIIVDACHSGTMTRDLGDEVKRELRPDALGVPQKVIDEIAEKHAGGAKKKNESQIFSSGQTRALNAEPDDGPVLVALYAAQSIEPTVEKRLPIRGDNRQYFGLLTYTMNEILSTAESKLTYRELVQKIHKKYVGMGRVSPTPVLEGNGLDREVLGFETLPDRPSISLSGSRFRGYNIDAGSLNGLTVNSILAVFPDAGAADADKAIGYVKVLDKDFQTTSAKVEPVEYGGLEAPKLKSGLRCKAVYVDFGDQRLRVAVGAETDIEEPVPDDLRAPLLEALSTFVADNSHLVEAVEDPRDAQWLLSYDSLAARKLYLTPVSGWAGEQDGELPPLFGPAPTGDELQEWLSKALSRMARVNQLLGITNGAAGQAWEEDGSLEVEIRIFKSRRDRQGEIVPFGATGIKLYNGDRIGFKVKNTSDKPLDVTMLMVDSAYGIAPLYPSTGQVNRLFPGNQVVRTGVISATTTGLEHLLVVATKAKPVDEPTNFSFLAQPSIERSRALGGKGMESALGKVFQNSLFGEGGTRGASSSDISTYVLRTLSWRTMKGKREAE